MKLINLLQHTTLFIVRRPSTALVLSLWIIVTAFFAILQFSPRAQKHFNSAMESYGYATASMIISSAADSALTLAEATNKKITVDLEAKESDLKRSKAHVAALELDTKSKAARLNNVDNFQRKANSIVKRHNVRLTKTVIKTAAGEVVAWIPVVGDAASIYFTVDGTTEMCNMFRELENTALEHGLPFYIYTDTFCERPIEKSKEAITETYNNITVSVGDSLREQSASRTDYWSRKMESIFK